MTHHAPLLLTAALAAAGCASVDVAQPSQRFFPTNAPMALVEGPSVPPPANDIPESNRVAWFAAHNPPPPPRVERVVVHETAPVHYAREHERNDDWVAPVSFVLGLGLGY